jgi:serine/threonine-protein kinase RsbW
MVNAPETIRLSFPINAAYVSSARLTASSIANRMGFDIDEIEDIKTAVSEACTYIIRSIEPDRRSTLEINFGFFDDQLTIHISTPVVSVREPQEGDISLMMIKAVVDGFEMTNGARNDSLVIVMIKKHKASLF